MSTQVQYRRGTGTQNDAFVGALAEITVDTTNKTLRVHDGATAGGSNIATVAYVDNAISSLSANSITDGTSSVTIIATNGNIRANVGGSTVGLFSSTGLVVTGSIEATGGFIGLDASKISNGTSEMAVIASGGNIRGNVGGATVTNIYSSGLEVTGLISATGNITGGNLSGTAISGTLSTAAQTNVTSVGTLTSLSVSGNVQGGNLRTAGLVSATGTVTGSTFVGSAAGLTAIPAANVTGTLSVNTTGYAATVSGAAQGNITSVGTLTSLSVSGNVDGGNLRTAGLVSATGTVTGSTFVGSAAGLTAIPAANVTGTLSVNTTGYAATVSGAAQANITSVGTLTSLSVSGNVQGGNLRTAGLISATGTVTGSQFNGSGAGLTSIPAANVTGTLSVNTTGYAATVSSAAQGNITSVGTLTSLSVSGNVDGGNLRTAGLVSATGTVTGTTFIGIANQAKYADLAEYYIADADYPVGTVLMFGGADEVTESAGTHVTSIAGTVSDKPAYTMNSDLDHKHKTPVALIGRVPCRVVGRIRKGDRLAASEIPGVATVLDSALYQPGCIIGKALEDYDSDQPGIIEVVVGRL